MEGDAMPAKTREKTWSFGRLAIEKITVTDKAINVRFSDDAPVGIAGLTAEQWKLGLDRSTDRGKRARIGLVIHLDGDSASAVLHKSRAPKRRT
jgi:hypothetical protein